MTIKVTDLPTYNEEDSIAIHEAVLRGALGDGTDLERLIKIGESHGISKIDTTRISISSFQSRMWLDRTHQEDGRRDFDRL